MNAPTGMIHPQYRSFRDHGHRKGAANASFQFHRGWPTLPTRSAGRETIPVFDIGNEARRTLEF
jgi:hypothetical protein